MNSSSMLFNLRWINFVSLCIVLLGANFAYAANIFVSEESETGSFPLVHRGLAAPIYLCDKDFSGVLKVARHLQADIHKVTGRKPTVISDITGSESTLVIIGTLGKNPLVDQLASSKKIDVGKVSGKWDTFGIQVVAHPLPGIEQALVIFGSDKRGTIYGVYELSRQMGVSPW